MSDEIMFFRVGEVCSVDCRFNTDDSSRTGQCLGKDSGRNHVFSCDLIALTDLYERGAELERQIFAEAMKRKKEIQKQIR